MSSTHDDQQNKPETSIHAKTLKNRKYRQLQKTKRDATKKNQIEKILELTKENDENAQKMQRLVKEGIEKNERIMELSRLLEAEQEKVKMLEKILEDEKEGEMLLDF